MGARPMSAPIAAAPRQVAPPITSHIFFERIGRAPPAAQDGIESGFRQTRIPPWFSPWFFSAGSFPSFDVGGRGEYSGSGSVTIVERAVFSAALARSACSRSYAAPNGSSARARAPMFG